jgi:hypothetical protein
LIVLNSSTLSLFAGNQIGDDGKLESDPFRNWKSERNQVETSTRHFQDRISSSTDLQARI